MRSTKCDGKVDLRARATLWLFDISVRRTFLQSTERAPADPADWSLVLLTLQSSQGQWYQDRPDMATRGAWTETHISCFRPESALASPSTPEHLISVPSSTCESVINPVTAPIPFLVSLLEKWSFPTQHASCSWHSVKPHPRIPVVGSPGSPRLDFLGITYTS